MIYWTGYLMLTILLALKSTLATIRLQSTQGMSIKQLSYPGMVCLGYFCITIWLNKCPPLQILETNDLTVLDDIINKCML